MSIAADITARDALVSGVRYLGMTVYVISEACFYQLIGGIANTNWSKMTRAFTSYATEADFVTAKGIAAVNGDTFYDTTENIVKVFADGSWSAVGSGTGQGGVNFITNFGFEKDLAGWVPYLDFLR